MAVKDGRTDLQRLYGMLLGGLMASFLGVTVFSIMQHPALAARPWTLMAAVMVGFVCATGLMIGGLFTTERLPWLAGALLWGSGFTMLWSVAISFAAEPRWITPLALGIAVAVAVVVGSRRFGRPEASAPVEGEGV